MHRDKKSKSTPIHKSSPTSHEAANSSKIISGNYLGMLEPFHLPV